MHFIFIIKIYDLDLHNDLSLFSLFYKSEYSDSNFLKTDMSSPFPIKIYSNADTIRLTLFKDIPKVEVNQE